MPKVSPEHLDARRQQILDAALECFAAKGFHATTMRDIIDRSRLSAGAIYRYFPGKVDIIDAIARARHERERALLAEALRTRGGARGLRELARAFFRALASPRHREERRVGVEVWAEALHSPDILGIVRRGVDEPRRLLADIVRQSQERRELSPSFDPEALASILIAIFQGFVLQQAWDPDADVERYLATLDALIDAFVPARRA